MVPDAAVTWDAARRAEVEAFAVAAAAERLGQAPRADASPRAAAEARAAGELLARQEAGEALEAGAVLAAGWRLAAGLALDAGGGSLAWLPTALWALAPPCGDGGGPVFVAAGGHAPEVWRWEEVRAELGARRRALADAEAFVRAAAATGARGNTGGEEEDPHGA